MSFRYPLSWRLFDAIERGAQVIWPRPLHGLTGYLLLLPAFLVVAVLVAGLGYIIEDSFHDLDISTYTLKPEYELANYREIFGRDVYWTIIGRSLLGAVLVTAITLALAFPYAYVLARTGSSLTRKLLLIALFLPFFIGQVVRAYGWLIILGQEGLLNSLLAGLGLPTGNFLYNYPAVLFGLVQYMLPFAVLMLVPAVTAIASEVEMASESLGARWPQTFRHVVIPMAKPGLIGASVVVFTLTLTDFAMPEIMGGGTTDFIASAIYDSFFQISDAGLGSALAVILVLLGTTILGAVFTLIGTGTLGFRSEKA